MKTVVFTSDNHNWLLKGFFHQWEKYGARKGLNETYTKDFLALEVAGFTKPEGLPDDVSFYSIGKMTDYPVEKWSDAVIKYLQNVPDDLVLILLEDYWMIRPINRPAIAAAIGFMADHQNVIRFDLASDRLYCQGSTYAGPYGTIDLCEGKGAYSMSLQASIFRRELLLDIMRPGETPWQAELDGTFRLNQKPYKVLGTYQWPMNYLVAMNKGKLDRSGGWMFPARTLTRADWQELDTLGYTIAPEAQNEHAL
jgi:hypothetical protein